MWFEINEIERSFTFTCFKVLYLIDIKIFPIKKISRNDFWIRHKIIQLIEEM